MDQNRLVQKVHAMRKPAPKNWRRTSRFAGEVWQGGKVIESAEGREAVRALKIKHGFIIPLDTPKP